VDIYELMACIFCSQQSLVAKLPFKQWKFSPRFH